jgi:hypothetical protein
MFLGPKEISQKQRCIISEQNPKWFLQSRILNDSSKEVQNPDNYYNYKSQIKKSIVRTVREFLMKARRPELSGYRKSGQIWEGKKD